MSGNHFLFRGGHGMRGTKRTDEGVEKASREDAATHTTGGKRYKCRACGEIFPSKVDADQHEYDMQQRNSSKHQNIDASNIQRV